MYWFFYRLAIASYFAIIRVVSFGNDKARQFILGRKNELPQPGPKNRFRLWIHVSSLGEFEQSRPVIEQLKKEKNPDITLTFFSPSGYEVKKNFEGVDRVLYMPADLPSKATEFVEHFQFDMALFVKYDFWMNHLKVCMDRNIPVVFISVILRDDQLYFNWAKGLYLPIFRKVDHFFVQNQSTTDLLLRNQIDQVTLAGDTRLDRVLEIAHNAPRIKIIEQLKQEKKLFVMGSVWPSDDEFLDPVYTHLADKFLFVLAPHDISESAVQGFIRNKQEVQLFSDYDASLPTSFLIINNMGMLAGLYAYADYTYVGGGFKGTLHNTMEAAAHGKPVFFGKHPNNRKFKEAGELVNAGGGYEVDRPEQMIEALQSMLTDERHYQNICQNSAIYVEEHSGATDIIVEYIKQHIT